MASDPTVDFPPGYERHAKEWGATFWSDSSGRSGRIDIDRTQPPPLSLADRLDVLRIAHATTDAAIRKHALLLLEQAAAPVVVWRNQSLSEGDLGGIREVSKEEMAELRRNPAFRGGI